jgi:CubicO group peptidase (beta-lactamase class C family)
VGAEASSTRRDDLEAVVDGLLERRIGDVTPGAAVAIVRSDETLLTKGYGTADVDEDTAVRPEETAFRVGSVGKLVTFTAVMQGVERGILDLDEEVNTYLADSAVTVPERDDEPVTLRHLGTHTAGFESALDPNIVADPDALTSLETLLDTQQPTRVRPPGKLVGYSNYGAALAGHVVAEAHETTFEEYVQSNIFGPLGMTHSTFAQPIPDDHPGTLAAGHATGGDGFETSDDVFINMRPAGSLSATATDMATFMRAHLGNGAVDGSRLLRTETARTMHDRHHVRHPAVTNWRYGFHEYGDPDGSLIGHSGGTVSFTSQLVLAPKHDLGIFVNYNSNSDELPAAVVDDIVAELGLQPAETAPTPTSKPGGRARLESVAGEYSASYLPDTGPLHVVDVLDSVVVEPAENGRLRTKRLNGTSREWVETDPYVFDEVGGPDRLAFEIEDGTVTAMHMSSQPTGVHQPVPPSERRLITGGVVGSSLAGFGLSLAGWAGQRLWRRWNRQRTAMGTEGDE